MNRRLPADFPAWLESRCPRVGITPLIRHYWAVTPRLKFLSSLICGLVDSDFFDAADDHGRRRRIFLSERRLLSRSLRSGRRIVATAAATATAETFCLG